MKTKRFKRDAERQFRTTACMTGGRGQQKKQTEPEEVAEPAKRDEIGGNQHGLMDVSVFVR